MSFIIDNFAIISLTESGKKHGIKPVSREYGYIGLSLPIGLKDEEESKQLISQIKELYDGIKVYVWYDHLAIEVKGKRKFLFKETAYVAIRRGENSIEIGTWSPRKKMDKSVIDTILRRTILGRRLKDYWISTEGISEGDAEKRLEELTPYAKTEV